MNVKEVLEKSINGFFVVHCPELKSGWSQGKTEVDALHNLQEEFLLFLEPDESRINVPC